MSSAFQKSRSNRADLLAACGAGGRLKATMIAQVQMLASSRPTITTFTTTSAWRNSATGDSVAASMLKNGIHASGSPRPMSWR